MEKLHSTLLTLAFLEIILVKGIQNFQLISALKILYTLKS